MLCYPTQVHQDQTWKACVSSRLTHNALWFAWNFLQELPTITLLLLYIVVYFTFLFNAQKYFRFFQFNCIVLQQFIKKPRLVLISFKHVAVLTNNYKKRFSIVVNISNKTRCVINVLEHVLLIVILFRFIVQWKSHY